MKKQSATDILSRDIQLLEIKQADALEAIKENVHNGIESLKPMHLIKGAFKRLIHSFDIKRELKKLAIKWLIKT